MGWLPTDDFFLVRRHGRRLEGERLLTFKIVMECWRYPHPVHSPLIQRTLNVEEVGHRSWHHEVHRAEFSH